MEPTDATQRLVRALVAALLKSHPLHHGRWPMEGQPPSVWSQPHDAYIGCPSCVAIEDACNYLEGTVLEQRPRRVYQDESVEAQLDPIEGE
jgi:hypothetical protein